MSENPIPDQRTDGLGVDAHIAKAAGTFVTSRKRFIVITRFLILAIVAFLAQHEAPPQSLKIIHPILVIFGISNVFLIFQSREKFEVERISGWLFAFDTFFVTVLVVYLQAHTTEFYLVYFLTIFIAASAKSATAAIATSLVTAMIYGVLTKYEKTGVELYSVSFFMRTIFFFVTAMVVGYFAEQVKKEREAKESAQRMLHLSNRLATLFAVSKQMVSTEDLDELARQVFASAVRVLDGSSGSLILLDEAAGVLRIKESTGLAPEAKNETIRIGEGIAGVVAQGEEAVLIEGDAQKDVRFHAVVHERHVRSAVCAPLKIGQKLLGVLNVNRGLDTPSFTDDDLQLLVALANHAAIVIEKARLYERLSDAYDASKSQYETLVNTANAMIFTTDASGVITFINEQGAHMLGKTPAEIEGKAIADFVHPDDVHKFTKTLEGVARHQRRVAHLEYRMGSGDSERRQYSASCAPIKDVAEDEYGVLGVAEDVTDYLMLQRHLAQTAKLATVGTMISGIAHELNNPLTAIIGFAGLLQERDHTQTPPGPELDIILKQAERCAETVRGLLKFARQEEAVKSLTDIHQVLRESLDLRRHEMSIRNIAVVEEYDQDLPEMLADASQIQQVFLNIISNAFDAMSATRGGGTLTIRTSHSAETLAVEFADEGGGIEDIEKIFDPFYTTKDVGKGTGLGLSISYGIVEEHGGRIEARNVEAGAVVTVTLPIAKPEGNRPTTPADPKRRSRKASVLVIDDEDVILQMSRQMLETMGHTVHTAKDAQEALSRLSDSHYDVLLTDIRMPGTMDGRQFYDWLKQNKPTLVPGVVFTTGDTLSPEVRAFIEQTGAAYLAKPFHLGTFKETINQILQNASA